jgi:hypothetical protein
LSQNSEISSLSITTMNGESSFEAYTTPSEGRRLSRLTIISWGSPVFECVERSSSGKPHNPRSMMRRSRSWHSSPSWTATAPPAPPPARFKNRFIQRLHLVIITDLRKPTWKGCISYGIVMGLH